MACFTLTSCLPIRFCPTSCPTVPTALFFCLSLRPRLLRCCLRRPRLSSLSSSCPFVPASSPSTRYFGLPTGSCCLSSTLIIRLLICACSRVLHLELTWSLVVTKDNFGYKSHCDQYSKPQTRQDGLPQPGAAGYPRGPDTTALPHITSTVPQPTLLHPPKHYPFACAKPILHSLPRDTTHTIWTARTLLATCTAPSSTTNTTSFHTNP